MFALEHFILHALEGVNGKRESSGFFECHCKKATVESVFIILIKKHCFQVHFCRLGNNEHKVFSLWIWQFSLWCNLPAYHFWLNTKNCTQISIIIGYGLKPLEGVFFNSFCQNLNEKWNNFLVSLKVNFVHLMKQCVSVILAKLHPKIMN